MAVTIAITISVPVLEILALDSAGGTKDRRCERESESENLCGGPHDDNNNDRSPDENECIGSVGEKTSVTKRIAKS